MKDAFKLMRNECVSKARQSTAELISLVIQEVQTSGTAVLGLYILNVVDGSDSITSAVITHVRKIVNSAEAKRFKHAYKTFAQAKNLPFAIFAEANHYSDVQVEETVVKEFLRDSYSVLTKTYAALAIAQSACRELKAGERRSTLLQQAQACEGCGDDVVIEVEGVADGRAGL